MTQFECEIGISGGQIVMDVRDADEPGPGTIYEKGRAVVGVRIAYIEGYEHGRQDHL